MHILLVYYEPFESGQTKHVLSLAKGLDRLRFQIEVVLPEHLETASRQFGEAGVRVIWLPMRKAFWKPSAIAQLIRIIREKHAPIVHVHSQEAGLVARLPAKLTGAKAILYTHQTIDIRQKRYFSLYTKIERFQATYTDKIISVNEFDRKRLESWGMPADKLITIYNGIDLNDFQTAVDPVEIRASLGLRKSSRVVMQIGRLTAQKSPLDFIDGAATILKQKRDIQFVLIGDGPLASSVSQRVMDLGLQNDVLLPGKRNGAFQLIPAAEIVTLTSLWEGTPYTLLEAMGWSKPVVATAVNGCPEIIQDRKTGLLVPAGNPERWALALMELLDDPDKAEAYGRAGRRRLEEKFSLARMIKEIESQYDQLGF